MRKRILSLLLAIVAVFSCLFVACFAEEDNGGEITVTDQAGNTVTLSVPERIVSGYFISTSVCLALGLKDKIVGVETGSEARPIYSKVAPDIISNAVNVGSAKNFDVENCLKADPDLVILPKKAEAYYSTLTELNIPTIVVNPESQTLLEEMITLIGKATGKEDRAKSLVDFYHTQSMLVSESVKNITETPRVYICNPNSYLKTAANGMYQSDLIKAAGGKNVADNIGGTNWATIDLETLISYDPEVIIVPVNSDNCQLPTYLDELKNNDILSSVSAVKSGRIFAMPVGLEAWDSPVPSGILGLLWLTKTLHPETIATENFNKTVNDFYKTYFGFDPLFS